MHRYNNVVVRKIKQFAVSEKGAAFIELAFSLPVLLLMLYGAVEISRYALINKKLQQVSSTVTNMVAQQSYSPISTPSFSSMLGQYMGIVQQIMSPYPFNTNGLVIITDVSGNSSPIVNWQYCGGGSLSAVTAGGSSLSQISTPRYGSSAINAGANMPSTYTSNSLGEIIVAEVFYQFTPLFGSTIIPGSTLSKVAYFVPRNGSLIGFNSTCP